MSTDVPEPANTDYMHFSSLTASIENMQELSKPTTASTSKFKKISEPMLTEDDDEVSPPASPTARPQRPATEVMEIEDNKVKVEISFPVPVEGMKSSPHFTIRFDARKVEVNEDSISVLMNNLFFMELPGVPVRLKMKIGEVRYTAAYAGNTISFGSFRLIGFIRVKE